MGCVLSHYWYFKLWSLFLNVCFILYVVIVASQAIIIITRVVVWCCFCSPCAQWFVRGRGLGLDREDWGCQAAVHLAISVTWAGLIGRMTTTNTTIARTNPVAPTAPINLVSLIALDRIAPPTALMGPTTLTRPATLTMPTVLSSTTTTTTHTSLVIRVVRPPAADNPHVNFTTLLSIRAISRPDRKLSGSGQHWGLRG